MKKKASVKQIVESSGTPAVIKPPIRNTNGKGSAQRNGKSRSQSSVYPDLKDGMNERELLRVLTEVKNGNFTIRKPVGSSGIYGKIYATLNDIISSNETLVQKLTSGRNTIAKEPKNDQKPAHEKKLILHNKSLQKELKERKVSEKKLNSHNSQLLENNNHLKAVNEELDRFAYIASHDLQEPLRKIMVFSDKILKTGTIDEASGKYFQKIISSSGRMQSLINDLLSFSRHSVSSLDFKRIDLTILVNEAIQELDLEIEKSGAKIRIEFLPTAFVIPSLMRQLFYNLVINALKFRKKGEVPVITIRSKHSGNNVRELNGKEPVNNYKIIVQDNGIGFDPKYSEDIFMVFKRLHSFNEFEGSGMGLSICKKIIEKHKGSISAKSTLGKGSTFTITIPVREL